MTTTSKRIQPVRSIVDRVFESAFGYRYLRGLFHFGVRMQPIRKALDLRAGDRVLDVGCGTGDYAPLVNRADCQYVGIDLYAPYIEKARQLYPAPNREYRVGDIRSLKLEPRSFNKALILGVMHHLTDEENLVMLRDLNRIISERIVIMDLSPGGWHVVNTILCRFDRGRYPRRLKAQCELLGRVFDVTWAGEYFVRSGIQRYSLIVCRPRPESAA